MQDAEVHATPAQRGRGRWQARSHGGSPLIPGAHGFFGRKVDEDECEGMMNTLGDAGWELVTAFDTNQGHGETRDVVALFNRARG